jgi:hypothetical protein
MFYTFTKLPVGSKVVYAQPIDSRLLTSRADSSNVLPRVLCFQNRHSCDDGSDGVVSADVDMDLYSQGYDVVSYQ